MNELLDISDLIPPGAGRRGERVEMHVERTLTRADLVALATAPERPAQLHTIQRLRASHHQVARLLAEGVRVEEAALATGYAAQTIYSLKLDPAFKELLTYYENQSKAGMFDMIDRLRLVGLDMLEELHGRLVAPKEGDKELTPREIMEAISLTLDRSGFGPSSTVKTFSGEGVDQLVELIKKEVGNRHNGQITTIDAQSYSRPAVDREAERATVVHPAPATLEGLKGEGEDL